MHLTPPTNRAQPLDNRWTRKVLDSNGDGTADSSRVLAYDGNQVALDFVHTGAGSATATDLRNRYLWGPAVDELLAEETVDNGGAEDVLWALTDHQNTVRDPAQYNPGTDTTTVVNHLKYDAFGNVTAESNPAVDSLFLYTVRPFDSDTGLQNNLNRWYDPRTGKWLSEDPVGFSARDENLYRYCGNAPVTHVDATGEAATTIDGAIEGCMQLPTYAARAKCLKNLLDLYEKTGGGGATTAAVKACIKKITDVAECHAMYNYYKNVETLPSKCDESMSLPELLIREKRAGQSVIARAAYLLKKCDDILPGSISKGSAKAKAAHEVELGHRLVTVANCAQEIAKKRQGIK